jgi:hypothetical protein
MAAANMTDATGEIGAAVAAGIIEGMSGKILSPQSIDSMAEAFKGAIRLATAAVMPGAVSAEDVAKSISGVSFADKFASDIEKWLGIGTAAVSHFAGGTSYAPGGLAVVGENGPELVNLPRGSQVYPGVPNMGGVQIGQIIVNSPDPARAGDSVIAALKRRGAF